MYESIRRAYIHNKRFTSLCKIVFLNAPCIAYDNLINTNDLIKNIDESLKKYYNLKKSYLKTKVDYL